MNNKQALVTGCIIATFLASLAGMQWNHAVAATSDDRPGTIVMFGVGLVAALLMRIYGRRQITEVTTSVGLAMGGGVLADAVLHAFIPPETGNLWPLGVVAVTVMGAIAGLLGALIGTLILWLTDKPGPRE